MSTMFTSYEEAESYLGKKSDRPYPVGSPRNTRVIQLSEGIGVRYHNTFVVQYTPQGIVLDTGGWSTVTTKARFNTSLEAIPGTFRVFSKKGVWYYGDIVFFDGLTIGYDGKIVNPPSEEKAKAKLAETKRLQKMLSEYVKKLKKLLENEALSPPSDGDCWVCSGLVGSVSPDTNHLMSHLEETYIVPSLIWKIAEERGSKATQEYLISIWNKNIETYSFYKEHAIRSLPNAVRRYFKDHLGI